MKSKMTLRRAMRLLFSINHMKVEDLPPQNVIVEAHRVVDRAIERVEAKMTRTLSQH